LVKRLEAGLDAEQVRLYCDYLYLATLYRDGRRQEVARLVDRMVDEGRVWEEERPIKSDEDHSYYTRTSLRNFILLVGFAAKAGLARHDSGEGLSLLVKYLDVKPILSRYNDLGGRDPSDSLIAAASPEAHGLFDIQPWSIRRAAEERPGLSGVGSSGGKRTVYLRGSAYHALNVGPGRTLQVLTPEGAADQLVEDCIELTRQTAASGPRAFTLLPTSGGVVAVLSDRPIVLLDPPTVSALVQRHHLPADHPFRVAWGAAPGVRVFVPSPVGTGRGDVGTDEMLVALRDTFREHRIVRGVTGARIGSRPATALRLPAAASAPLVFAGNRSPDGTSRQRQFEQQQKLALAGAVLLRPERRARDSQPAAATEVLILFAPANPRSELEAHVRLLGGLGQLEGRLVVLATPRSGAPLSLVSEAVGLFGATAVFTFDTDVTDEALIGFASRLREQLEKTKDVPGASAVTDAAGQSGLSGWWNL